MGKLLRLWQCEYLAVSLAMSGVSAVIGTGPSGACSSDILLLTALETLRARRFLFFVVFEDASGLIRGEFIGFALGWIACRLIPLRSRFKERVDSGGGMGETKGVRSNPVVLKTSVPTL